MLAAGEANEWQRGLGQEEARQLQPDGRGYILENERAPNHCPGVDRACRQGPEMVFLEHRSFVTQVSQAFPSWLEEYSPEIKQS